VPRLFTIGYEKLLPPELVAELQHAGVERLIDVRFRAQSRRPGMSKTRLGELLGDHGIAYEHRRALGTPPDIRWFFRHGREAEGREAFREHVEANAPEDLDALAAELATPVLLMFADEDEIAWEHVRALHDALPRAELAIVPGQDHGHPSGRPDLFAAMVLTFLAAC